MVLRFNLLARDPHLVLPDLVDSDAVSGVVACFDGFGEDLSDFAFLAADAVGDAVDDDLRREDAVAGPLLDVGLLARVPGGVAEGVFPAGAGVPVCNVVGQEEDIVVL